MAELFLVEFKGSRKEYFYNTYHHSLKVDDYVITQAEQGEDLGWIITHIDNGDRIASSEKPRSILRPAGNEDMARFTELKRNEVAYKGDIVKMVRRHGLVMKIVDVECQFDGNKITFFFTADHRVDFRALVRDLAAKYRTRIELRQIGVRDEARRIGGYGICGRQQCCNSHIKEFVPISTQHAREQDLPLNPSKISGNCGRLLCCLRYESDLYHAVKARFPSPGTAVRTTKGDGVIERIDVFNEEAVILTEDRLTFRIAPQDIKDTVGATAPQPRPALDDAEIDIEQLSKLEDESANGKTAM
ncbi:MAG: regulatory iron-sulfur-containing complex subunit RicT [candidate division Zixibacteria bacterium]|jgi:cell fate regulator YaaT (PSP1 superfamily)|nr:regulatory iron-sulfur-containing complex subunit RicT [candidate division Zixibacteria bacterium]